METADVVAELHANAPVAIVNEREPTISIMLHDNVDSCG